MTKPRCILFLIFVALTTTLALAKNESVIVVTWPADKPALKLSFDKFRREELAAGESKFISDVTIQNLTDKPLPRAAFTLYFAGKDKLRIGEGLLQVSDLEPRQTVKIEFRFTSF